MQRVKNPKFQMNQEVWFKVEFKNGEIKTSKYFKFVVMGIVRTSSATDVEYEYWLSQDPPSAYHSGRIDYRGIKEDVLYLEQPSDE